MWRGNIVCCCIFTGWILEVSCAVRLTQVAGNEGKNISFNIRYPASFAKHDKYFGRWDGIFYKKLVQTAEANRWARRGRFAVFDRTAALVFTVFISGLVMEDSGLYFCGMDLKLQADPLSEIQITVRKGEGQRLTTPPRVVVSSLHSPVNVTVQNWPKNRNQESHLRLVTVLSLVCVCILLCVCPFGVSKILKRVAACKLSVLVSYHTRRSSNQVVDQYVKMSPNVLPDSPVDRCSAEYELDRVTNTGPTPDIDPCYIDVASALTEGLDADQIYTKMNAESFQESVYQIIDQTSD